MAPTLYRMPEMLHAAQCFMFQGTDWQSTAFYRVHQRRTTACGETVARRDMAASGGRTSFSQHAFRVEILW